MSPKLVGPDGGQRPPHAFRFELEHADRIAALEQLVDRRIVPRQRSEIDLDALLVKQALSFLEDRKRLETEKVELHQPRRLDIFHVELGDRHVRPRIAVERDKLVERTVADHDACSVGRSVARQALQLHRQVEQSLDVRVACTRQPPPERRSAIARASTDRSDGWG